MEVKLRQGRELVPLPNFLQNPIFPFRRFPLPNFLQNPPFRRPSLKSWINSESSFKKHFRGLVWRWRLQMQEISKGQHFPKHFLVHVVKKDETLTSISKKYGVSVYSIAAVNKNILNVNLVFEGQLLNIPSAVGITQVFQTKKSRLLVTPLQERCQGSLHILDGLINQKILAVLSSHRLHRAKTTGYFLVLVPLIAFCMRCIIGAFSTRVAEDLRRETVIESENCHHGSRSMRWKSALFDTREPDNLEAESHPNSNSTGEDQAQTSFEEVSHSYTKLEHDYQKFLSECGVSESGYWRGGSPE